MSTKEATAIAIKAKITVNYPGGTSAVNCTTAQGLADEALHCLIQAVGTEKAWTFINEKMSGYQADYKGYTSGS
jgi:hypothetical protein